MKLLKYHFIASASILTFGGAIASQPAHAETTILISDSLSVKDHPGQTPGKSLDGVQVQKGMGDWLVTTAHPPYTSEPWSCSDTGIGTAFSSAGDSITWTFGAPASEPTNANAEIPPSDGKITVEADIEVGSASWGAVTLQHSPQNLVFTPGSYLIAALSQDGTWTLYRDEGATQKNLATGKLEGFSPNAFSRVGLQYSTITGKASLLLNGKDVSGPVNTGLDLTTQVGSAGLYFYGPKDDLQIKNFQVSLDSSR